MLIHEMVKAGYQKHICLGTDAGRRTYHKTWGSGVGIDYDETVFLPRLRDEGLSEDAIQDIYIKNPARFFSIEKLIKISPIRGDFLSQIKPHFKLLF